MRPAEKESEELGQQGRLCFVSVLRLLSHAGIVWALLVDRYRMVGSDQSERRQSLPLLE
jgi:hypothetical protein